MREIWKDIPNYEGLYQASTIGNIRSLNYRMTKTIKNLKTPRDNKGYKLVGLNRDGNKRVFRVHMIMALTFLNHRRGSRERVIDHIDNNRLNNNLDNLQIITHRENCSKDRTGYSSSYVGVSWDRARLKWKSTIQIKGKMINIGRFDYEIDAHNAYQKALRNG